MKIAVFSRSQELNGIHEIRRSLPELDPRFVVAETTRDLIQLLRSKPSAITHLFCLSSTDALIGIWVLQRLKKNIPVLMGVYHPQQWEVMLNQHYSKTRASIFQNILAHTPASAIVYNSQTAYASCMQRYPIPGNPLFSFGASRFNGANQALKRPSKTALSVITVGRYVDFKLYSILHMMTVIDQLNTEGLESHYHIHGEGPSKPTLENAIAKLRYPERIHLHNALPPAEFAKTVANHDLFFGMGFALCHAAMMGLPALIAIQSEEGPKTYGFFSAFDHEKTPMFGDPTEGALPLDLETEVRRFCALSDDKKINLGLACKAASTPYLGSTVAKKLADICAKVPLVQYPVISMLDILKIRLESYWSRFFGKSVQHV
ncbi:MAG: hypothetical protein AB7F28_06295 [Candidatus Margulisiibacteriota bacterium]